MVSIGLHINHEAGFSSEIDVIKRKDSYYLLLLGHFLNLFIPDSKIEYYQKQVFDKLGESFHDSITIFNEKTNKYVVVDFRDGPFLSVNYISDENLLGAYASMYKDGLKRLNYSFVHKYKPFYFFDQYPNLTKSYVKKIKKIRADKSKLIPKMSFSGTIGDELDSTYIRSDGKGIRNIVRVLKEKYPDIIDVEDRDNKLPREEWWEYTSRYLLTLTVPGHPWCFREHECWALGIATIANTYTSPLPQSLIPDKHYIDCNTSGKNHMDSEFDDEKSADLIAEKFLKVFLNYKLIEAVEKNAMMRYNQFNHPEKAARYLKKELKSLKLF